MLEIRHGQPFFFFFLRYLFYLIWHFTKIMVILIQHPSYAFPDLQNVPDGVVESSSGLASITLFLVCDAFRSYFLK